MIIHKSVAIVGAGFSGSLLAVNVLRHAGPAVTLIERRPVYGRGKAYSAPNPSHLLNVRAGNMSALRDVPQHFAYWCVAHGIGDASSFVPRQTYGTYVTELLGNAACDGGNRLTLLNDDALCADVREDQVRLHLASGATVVADALVLALGN